MLKRKVNIFSYPLQLIILISSVVSIELGGGKGFIKKLNSMKGTHSYLIDCTLEKNNR